MHPQSRSPPGRQELKTGESPEVLWSASLEYAVMNKSNHVNNVERTPIVALSPISMCCGVCTPPPIHRVWGKGEGKGEILNLKVSQTSDFIIHTDSLGACHASRESIGLRFFRSNRLERSAASWAALRRTKPEHALPHPWPSPGPRAVNQVQRTRAECLKLGL